MRPWTHFPPSPRKGPWSLVQWFGVQGHLAWSTWVSWSVPYWAGGSVTVSNKPPRISHDFPFLCWNALAQRAVQGVATFNLGKEKLQVSESCNFCPTRKEREGKRADGRKNSDDILRVLVRQHFLFYSIFFEALYSIWSFYGPRSRQAHMIACTSQQEMPPPGASEVVLGNREQGQVL